MLLRLRPVLAVGIILAVALPVLFLFASGTKDDPLQPTFDETSGVEPGRPAANAKDSDPVVVDRSNGSPRRRNEYQSDAFDERELTAAVSQTAAIPGLSRRETLHSVSDQVRYVQPGSDTWSTEALGAEAGRRLLEIVRLMNQSDATPSAPAPGFLTADFRCGSLRPATEIVYRDGPFTVRRAGETGNTSSASDSSYTGAVGLREALAELTRPFGGARPIHVKFKVIRVEDPAGDATTSAYFQADAETSTGSVQQNATWRCQWQKPPGESQLQLAAIEVEDFREVTALADDKLFVDCTQSVLEGNACYTEQFQYGTDYWQSRLDGSFGIDIAALEGLAVGDANGDGLDDVYVCQSGGLPNRLLVQNPDGTATDRASEAGVDWQELTRSALWVDLDNDGDQDLVLALRYEILVMANDGRGGFSVEYSYSHAADLFSIVSADYDRDGDLDIYVCARNDTNSPFRHGTLGTPVPYHDANNGAANVLLENQGAWNFKDVTQRVGLDENNRRFSYAAAWDDFDNDGDQDLYVANDHGRNNLYENLGGRFRDVAATAGVEDMAAGMSASWADFNRDGWMDLYVSNMFSSAGGRITYQRQFQDEAGQQTRAQYQRHARGNTLFVADGHGRFRDVSEKSGVNMGRWAWGSLFFDMNNDGWQDIYVTNGFVTGPSTDDL